MEITKLQDVNKSYGNSKVLVDVSLSINEGEFVAIIGESGKGKSTLLNIIGLFEDVDSGSVIIDGVKNIKPNSTNATKIIREKISYLFQNFALVDEETVNYNLNLSLKYIKIPKKEKEERIKKCANQSSCLLYTSDAADDTPCVDLGGRRIIKKKKKIQIIM
eukprot:TRINITY_DN3535_c0_g1_i4.p2 TRINITY_DN3535_c0_g1~~TRINITY_DN3535_c0_g1_i4.p2  ORF type:complete len:162 (-),score=38.38 TRINITY_DN3535_c0_g1_i4:71-556(-)